MVGAIGKRDHAFEVVIAVNPSSNHPKGQVDLGTPVVHQRMRGGFGIRFSSSTGRHRECKIQINRTGMIFLSISRLKNPSRPATASE